MPLHRLFAGLLVATVCSTPAAAQHIAYDSTARSWTLTSGPVSYRLFRRGPAGRLRLRRSVARARVPPASLRLLDSCITRLKELRLRFVHASLPLQLDVRYAAWGETGVFSREIRLTNRGDRPLAITRLPSIGWELPGGDYTLRYLWGSWGQERQLATETLSAGARRFEQTRGRSTNRYVPWLSLRNRTLGVEYIAELAWSGNWWMQVERQPGAGATPLSDQPVQVELGLMLRVPMNGQFGISGRIPEWSAVVRHRVAANVALYRRIRGTITGADIYHLTPPPRRNGPTGWTALEYVEPDGQRAVVLAYRLARSPE